MKPGLKSLTKNWPGGRRTATVISAVLHEGSAPLWNTVTASFTRPYGPIEVTKEADIKADMVLVGDKVPTATTNKLYDTSE